VGNKGANERGVRVFSLHGQTRKLEALSMEEQEDVSGSPQKERGGGESTGPIGFE